MRFEEDAATIRALRTRVDLLEKIKEAAFWAHSFMTKDCVHEDDGDQWDAIAGELSDALDDERNAK